MIIRSCFLPCNNWGQSKINSFPRIVSLPSRLARGNGRQSGLHKEIGEGAVLATDDGKAIKTCRFLNLPFIISPKIARRGFWQSIRVGVLEAFMAFMGSGLVFCLAMDHQ